MNSGIYAFDGLLLADAVKRVSTDNAQGEEYLTDVLSILRRDGHRVGACVAADFVEVEGVNDRVQLGRRPQGAQPAPAGGPHASEGHDHRPRHHLIDVGVKIGPDAVVHPATQLHGATVIEAYAEVGPGTTLTDTYVGEGAVVRNAVCDHAEIGPEANVGPYAYLRPGTVLGHRSKAGTFVEMKNTKVGQRSKVPHLSYAGDATIGDDVNIGASTVFVNYDGVDKHHTTVRDGAFVGCDTMLVAPVTVGDGAYTAAGSTITDDVPRAPSAWPAHGSATSRNGSCAGARARSRPRPPSGRWPGKIRRKSSDQHQAARREEPHALLRPGPPRAGR